MSVPVEFVNDRGNKVEIKDTEARRLAGVAQTAAENAQSTAGGANTLAQQAKDKADTAYTDAGTAQSTATAAGTLAQQAKDIADAASSAASTNTENISTLNGKVTALEGSISDIEEDIETIKEDYISKEELQPYDILEETDNLPLTFTTNGESLIDYKIYGNSNSNHIDEVTNNLPITIPNAKAGIVEDWTIEGNNIPQVENITKELPITFPSNGDNITDYTIYGNNNPCEPEQTSVLPITFETVEDKLRDWSISGNDEPGENHWHQNAYSTTINDVLISADTSSLTISSNGSSATISATSDVWKNAIKTLIGSGEYTYQYSITGTHTNMAIGFYKSDDTIVFTSNQNAYSGTFTSDNAEYYNGFYLPNGWSGNITVTQMLVKGSTAPDHYIPYQKGVGERTAQLFDFQQFADGTQTTTNGGLTFTRDNDTIVVNALSNANYPLAFLNDKSGLTVPQLTQGQTYSGKLFISNAPSGSNIYVDVVGKNQGGDWTWIKNITASGNSFTLSTAYDIYGYRLVCQGTGISYENTQVKFVLTEGSTIPDYFIPYGYEIPISTQGKNLFDKSNLVTGSYYTAQGQTGNSDDWSRTVNAIPVQPSTEYTFEPNSTAGASAKHLYLDADKNFISAIASGGSTFTTPSNCYYMQFSLRTSSTNVMLVKGSTAPQTYIPYFHNNYTFYIGSTPLRAGQSISKTSTGVDITTQVGENTISTTLYNKPVMYCGKALGVGIPTENLFDKNAKDIGNGYKSGYYISSNGTTYADSSWDVTEYIPCAPQTTYNFYNCVGNAAAICWYDSNKAFISGSAVRSATGFKNIVLESPVNASYVRTCVLLEHVEAGSVIYDRNVDVFMITLESTDPTSYIPYGYKVPITITDENSNTVERTFYIGNSRLLSGDTYTKTQAGIDIPTTSGNNIIDTTLYNKPEMNVVCNSNVLGVGLKSENILPSISADNGWRQGYRSKSNGGYSSTHNNGEFLSPRISTSGITDFTICAKAISGTNAISVYFFDADNTYLGYTDGSDYTGSTFTVMSGATSFDFALRTFCNTFEEVVQQGYWVMLVKGSTAPSSYIPYGYGLPITVTDSSNNSTNYTFQLGSSPLTEGQSISKTSTGTDIVLLSGTNTISTTLGNKPEMRIDYESAEVGVGEPTENLFNINESALVQIDAQETMRFGVSVGALKAETYTLSFDKDSSSNYSFWIVERRGTTYTRSGSIASSPYTFTLSADADEVIVQTSYQRVTTWEALGLTNIMLVKGSTAPENFIPYGYEIPIRIYDGEANTENTNYTDLNFYIGNSLLSADEYIDFINNKIYKYVSSVLTPTNPIVDLPVIPTNGTNTIDTTLYNKPEMYIKYSTDSFSRIFTTTLPTTFINHSDKVKDWIIYGNESGVGEEGNDGYIIPLVVNGNTINIPIGNAALTEGETVSRTSTNIDIPTIDGENTINTTLTNKPTMKITKDFVTKEYIEDVANSCMNDNVEDIVENVVDEQMSFMFYSPINKNGMFRGKDLTNVYTIDEIYQKVSSGTFDDLYLGDYFTKSITTDIYTKFTGSAFVEGTTYYTRTGTLNNWVYAETEDTSYDSSKTYYTKTTKTENVSLMIAHFNYYYNIGDTAFTNPHIILTNRNYGFATTSKMNPTNTTVGGYYNSEMHQTTLPCYAKSLKTALNNHLLSHKTLLSNAINASTPSMAGAGLTGASSGWAWYDTELQLMTEQQLFGSGIWTSSAYDVGCDGEKLAVFNFVNGVQNGRNSFWLRSVASSAGFANCYGNGLAYYFYASYAGYVRPLIVFG